MQVLLCILLTAGKACCWEGMVLKGFSFSSLLCVGVLHDTSRPALGVLVDCCLNVIFICKLQQQTTLKATDLLCCAYSTKCDDTPSACECVQTA